jgi:small subunit ribosomal protein S1
MSMDDLLAAEETAIKQLSRGEVIDGSVVSAAPEVLVVDVGAKSEGVVPPSEMQSLTSEQRSELKAGDTVLVYVLQPEAEDGQVTLSIDRARGEQGWRVLQGRYEEGEVFDASVSGFNKGGLLVNVEGVNAFIPLSQVVGASPDRGDDGGGLAEYVGRSLRLKVIEMNRRRNRVILSERAALQEWRAMQKDRLLAELKEGEIREGTVTSIRSFGVFVDLGGADGLVHLSELSWDRDVNPEEMFKVNDPVSVYVMKIDQESKKIGLSIRRARPEEWDGVVASYEVGQIVPSEITKLVTFGAFARLDGPVEGLIHVSELVDRRIAHPKEVVAENEIVPVKIVRIERDRHRLGLSLRQARVEAEPAGWVFNQKGGIHELPADVAEKYERPAVSADPDSVPAKPEPLAAETPSDEVPGGVDPQAAAADEQSAPATAMEAALQRAGLSEQDLRPDGEET